MIHIGIDSGTQSTKAVALDLERGQVVASARAPHALIPGLPPGHMEQHPRNWTIALDATLAELAARLGPARRRRVRSIGVSGQQHGFVPLDEEGRVIRPAKLWCDTSTTAECALLTKKLGGEKAVLRKTGVPFLPGYTAPKILWLKRREPANYRRLRHVLLPHDYLNFHLTGTYFMEPGDASGTALMDIRRRAWSREALQAIDKNLENFLPPLSPSDVPAGTLLPAHARRLGFPENVTVSAGGGDNMMGAVGTGNVSPGVVTASLGTSGTIFAHAGRPVVDPRGEIAAFCSSDGGWLPLLCTMNVTTVTEQIRALFKQDVRALDRAAAGAPAGSAGLLMLPYLAGERTPNLPHATGVLYGLSLATLNPAYLARAAMEGVTLNLNHGLRRLMALGIRPREIRLTGGGAKSGFWRQLMADIFDVPVVAMKEDEGAALGAALQSAWCVSRQQGAKETSLAELTGRCVKLDERTRAEPDRKNTALYQELQARHDALSQTLWPR
ncbi:xylulokinase [Termitidicoccus mucosus]|uniref:Xylulose kinase n=1 Tax=Termitidicoccus mucosus TaxID=1184151 RepID=A0A178IE63_9BACT|nr:xylulokinase [Opitutaceae bacterium TSB47]